MKKVNNKSIEKSMKKVSKQLFGKMREVSYYEMLRLHRELWFWIENRPDKWLNDWPRWWHNGGDINESFGIFDEQIVWGYTYFEWFNIGAADCLRNDRPVLAKRIRCIEFAPINS